MKTSSVVALFAALVSIAASSLVAMRVETEILGPAGENTALALIIQIAPEDRPRVGRDAWLKLVLRQAGDVVESYDLGVDVDSSGVVRYMLTMAPGRYQVRADIEGINGNGFWTGTIDIPAPGPVPQPPQEPAPTPAPAPPELPTPSPSEPARPATEPVVVAVQTPSAKAPEPPQPVATPRSILAQPSIPAATSTKDPLIVYSSNSDPELVEVTMMAIEDNRPLTGLGSQHLRLRVDGGDVAIAALNSSAQAPLSIGLAIDTSGSMAARLGNLIRPLNRFAARGAGDTGRFFVLTQDVSPDLVLDWGQVPSQLASAVVAGSAGESDLAGMISAALKPFSGRRGRKFLVLVSDGGDTASRAAWKGAFEAVQRAGVPILVIGFKGDQLSNRTRSNLENVANISGGKSYFLPDTGMLKLVVNHLGELIDASYAVCFRPSGKASRTGLRKLAIKSVSGDFDVRHPAAIGPSSDD